MITFPVVQKPPFRKICNGRSTFHCKNCNKYKSQSNFFPSYLSRQYRTCVSCVKKRDKSSDLQRLKRSIYKILHGRQELGLAQRISREFITNLCDFHNVSPADVQTFQIPRDPLDFDRYKPKLRVLRHNPLIFQVSSASP